ncbi:MAG: hypothetical protein AUG49_22750 [Catenulispora sp. 13_1_20CM_3_70_7]|nr:MAG: hypothetical protein AUG49_22750 [Catenulispora sp. 13_1_20CM_3_70_7]
MTTRPEAITLPHTGLQVPANHPHVVSMSSLPTPNGTTLVALVRFDDRDVGTIEGTADGGDLWFRPAGSADNPARLEKFAVQCRHHGQPVTDGHLMKLLVEEWQINNQLLKAIAEGQTVARFAGDSGTLLTLTLRVFVQPQATGLSVAAVVPADVVAALAEVADDPGGHWQVWTGAVWQQVQEPEAAEQDGSDR